MAGPAFGLMIVFILLPFVFAIGLSFTNQRLIPTAFWSDSFGIPKAREV